MFEALILLINAVFFYGAWRFTGFLAKEFKTTRFGLLTYLVTLSWLTRR